MTETFLILLAAGVMLAAAVSSSKEVTLHWLRLAGIIALAVGALALFFFLRRELAPGVTAAYRRRQLGLALAVIGLILAQLAFVQSRLAVVGRIFSWLAFVAGVMSGSGLLHELMLARGTAVTFPSKLLSIALQTLSCAGVAAVVGLALMEMLLGHAYLTASRMTMRPFQRLNALLALALALRILTATALALALNAARPREMLWGLHGVFIGTRYFVGFLVPAVFVYMAHDCIRRRATQSATGILYVAGVLLFLGEIVALYLVRETGLPF
jgi:hypothetical protein